MKSANGKVTTTRMNSAVVEQHARKAGCSLDACFALEIRIRGRTDYLHQEVCNGLEDAIRIGEKWFSAFQARSPWFVQDSKGKRIFILLDPETESLLRL